MQQTIKEVNQSLIDDHQVQTDKIGSGNFFWAFPAKAYQDQLAMKEAWNEAQANSLQNIEKIKAEIASERVHRSGSERKAKMTQLQQLLQEEKMINQRLEELKGNDPEEIERVERETKRCKVVADLWTDNIYAMKTYLTRKKGMNSKEVLLFPFILSLYIFYGLLWCRLIVCSALMDHSTMSANNLTVIVIHARYSCSS